MALQKVCLSPLHLIMYTRDIPLEKLYGFKRVFGTMSFEFHQAPRSRIDASELLPHTTQSTMDRLYLTEIMAGQRRAVYLDIDVLPFRDPRQIWCGISEESDSPILAKPNKSPGWSDLDAIARRYVAKFPLKEVREFSKAYRPGMAETFNAGVLGIDFGHSRCELLFDRARQVATKLQVNDQFALNFAANGDFVALNDRWNHIWKQDPPLDDIHIVHWVGGRKPWNSLLVPYRKLFTRNHQEFLRLLAKCRRA